MKKASLICAAAFAIAWMLRPHSVLSHERVTTTVTYDREIVRIFNRKCIACHSEKNLGVALTTYENTRPWARAIEEEVLRRHMPPWRAVPGYGQFANDVGLTNRELNFIVAWVEGNGPKTKDQRLIVNIDQGRTDEDDQLRPDFTRWQLGKPDLLKTFAPSAIDPGRRDEVRRVTIDLGLTADRWIRALEFKPGDRRVVRAAFFSLEETGQWLGSWTPWHGVTTLPENVAYHLKAGSRVVADIHYRGADEPVSDQGSLGLYYAQRPGAPSPADLVIQTSAQMQTFSGSVTLASDVDILALRPDVQPGVESVEVTARKPGGTVQVLLLVRNALADWPTPYILKRPLRLPKGAELRVTYYYSSAPAAPPSSAPALVVSTFDSAARVVTTQ